MFIIHSTIKVLFSFFCLTLFSICIQLPLTFDLLFLFVFLALIIEKKFSELALASFSLLFCCLTAEVLFRNSLISITNYKPLNLDFDDYQNLSFKKNINASFTSPHGDLAYYDPYYPKEFTKEKKVEFKTDSKGYRNSHEHFIDDVVFIGDSFLVGASDQEETLCNIYEKKFNRSCYSTSFYTNPIGYETLIQKSIKDFGKINKMAVFFFEGNDFFSTNSYRLLYNGGKLLGKVTHHKIPRLFNCSYKYSMLKLKWANEVFPFFKITNKLNILFNNLTYKIYQPYNTSVDYFKVNGEILGYMSHQTPGEFESTSSLILKNKKIWQNAKCIFFIPSKQRVYLEYLDPETKNKILSSEYAYNLLLSHFKETKVIDLTPVLQNEAKILSAKNEYVYFIDDTHWNKNGINAVLPTIDNCLND